MNKTITVAKTAGFCFGVDRAVKIAYETAEKGTDKKIYTLGPLIHNPSVVEDLEKRGISVINSPSEASEGDTVIIRSHGVGRDVFEELESRGVNIVDATCPFVTKIHKLVAERTKAGDLVLIAGDKDHPEVQGILGWTDSDNSGGGCAEVFPNCVELVKLLRKNCEKPKKGVAILSQTTYNIRMWNQCIGAVSEFSGITVYDTICTATEKRQSEASELSRKCDTMLIIGGRNSSNTKKLYDVCSGNSRCYLIEDSRELKDIDFSTAKSVGISAGASTPAYIIEEVKKDMTEILSNEEEFNFEEAIEQSLKKIYTGKRVSGVVTAVNSTEVIVDIGTKHTGYIPLSELSADPNAKPEDVVKVGDTIDVIVTKLNDVEGIAMLSKKQVDAQKGYDDVKKAYESGEVLTGTVTNIIKGGVIVTCNGMRVFVPASQTGVRAADSMDTLLKKEVRFKIIELNEQRKRAVGSIRKVTAEERAQRKEAFFATAEVGQTILGEVKSITDYGVFVDVGGVDGLVRRMDLTWARIKHPSDVVSVGDHIEVTIKDIDKETGKVSLVYKKTEDNPWVIFEKNYSVGQTVEVKIVSITGFGAFAQIIPGIDGLIHISQIANQRVANVSDFLTVGDVVTAKITDCDIANKRVSLSIRALLPDGDYRPVKETAPAEEEASAEEASEAAEATKE
ncbi:MAG: bifunctional 4-hydroxy-3-methylbut-2-enyl diphosphate reductase/30S ribosomal protein S1 [Oscillospiraceae bacterium]|nr:bifunctional 4-hydroxy-3-methylbut-2-enyl diphosphate reductase/30S ribosomal protein S1 [Oscillospiraceae bacterium]